MLKGLFNQLKILLNLILLTSTLISANVNASFIESTIGAAVVNDATATFYNPAALTLVKKPQVIGLGSVASLHTKFSGQATLANTSLRESGSTSSDTYYFLPSFYVAGPVNDHVKIGFAVISNMFHRDVEENSILRYVQSKNQIQDIDFVPAIGIQVNQYFSIGAGLNFSYAHFVLNPISGIPRLNIPDSQSHNESSARSLGSDLGLLIKPNQLSLIGFNYRSAITYHLKGSSVLRGNPTITSHQYGYQFWTPGRAVVSINQNVTSSLGFIGTVQYIQWNIFKKLKIRGIATQVGLFPTIIPEAIVLYHLHNAWVFTLGTHYRINPKWIVRAAATYNQSPANPNYQISTGDSIIVGGSMGYEVYKNIILDGSYAHAFIKNQNIHIQNRNMILGVNSAYRDSASLKLTVNWG